ncbi:HAD superfamily- subfamily IIIB acid phosphatase [Striga hermonthica]|uniref:HAD superfamily- subfamily IIIB acid phosphatase n=1 Tax=Striga hermonthica TaxID=68872 RepID=A0A9N7RNS4_STRHE|nr:HAD superfamily- subfamily IIIB acid phosphatase [Striga hermonthica]
MARIQLAIVALLILTIEPSSSARSFIQLPTDRISGRYGDVDLHCGSWKFTVETNSAGTWSQVPQECVDFVKDYISGERYLSDSDAVAGDAVAFVKEAQVSGNGKDAWVFDIDETLLSNVPYYAVNGYGFDNWVDLAEAPALSASLRLYKELQSLGFTIFLLTGRSEFQRNATEVNLMNVGYTGWKRLILRGDSDQGKDASVYKSEKRKEIEDEGYIIQGNSGDQWSDLTGYAVARRSFKLPNPMYYIP